MDGKKDTRAERALRRNLRSEEAARAMQQDEEDIIQYHWEEYIQSQVVSEGQRRIQEQRAEYIRSLGQQRRETVQPRLHKELQNKQDQTRRQKEEEQRRKKEEEAKRRKEEE